jgi:MFS family permease
MENKNDKRIFWGCFIALIACAFGFTVRTQIIGDWQAEFNLDETQKGSILGVGFWPFAFSIFLFSLVIDKVGYGRAAFFGFLLHVVSTLMLVTAKSYSMLYWGTFLFALSNGTVEAYINPVVATMFSKDKTNWLNILHAGWPGGIVLAGIWVISMGGIDWQWKVGLTLLPTVIYALLLLGTKFPVSERVAAGVSYREMLQDFGALGAFVAVYLVTLQIFEQKLVVIEGNKFLFSLVPALIIAGLFGMYVKSLGRPFFFCLLLVMMPLATTELGIDSWITELMKPEMKKIGIAAGWVLVYTAAIMTILRFFAGAIAHKISPLGLLACSALLAIVGLVLLSKAAGVAILVAATVYGMGKTFFWPTMLGVVSERFPKGGALTLNTIGGVGMLSLSVGSVFLGNIQDKAIDRELVAYDQAQQTTLHETYMTSKEKRSLLGKYRSLDQVKVKTAPEADKETLTAVTATAKKEALSTAAIMPVVMLVAYLAMIFYFKTHGGYKAKVLTEE